MRNVFYALLLLTIMSLFGCGGGGGNGGVMPPANQGVAKAADFTSGELAGKTVYAATPSNPSGSYDAYSFNADGTVKAVTGITASGGGTASSGTWTISSGILNLSLPERGVEATKLSASADSNDAFAVASGTGAPDMRWFFNQGNGDAQALACATGAAVPPPSTFVGLYINPYDLTVGVGFEQHLSVTALYQSDRGYLQKDVTALATWSSSDSAMLAVSSSGVVTALAPGSATVKAAWGSGTTTETVQITPEAQPISGLTVTPTWFDEVKIPLGSTQQFKAVATYAGHGSRDVTALATWTSSDSSVATVSESGVATALAAGMVDIGVSYEGRSFSTVLYSGITVTRIAGSERTGFADGVGAVAQFKDPGASVTDGVNLYVTDTGNHCIRKVVIATGAVTTLAGAPSVPGSSDGVGAGAQFRYPDGITTDGTNLYVTDQGNSTIRRIAIATGAVTTIAGAPGSTGFTDGIGTSARFDSPAALAVAGGYLYVSDWGNTAIRKVDISTGAVSTLVRESDFPNWSGMISIGGSLVSDGTRLYGTLAVGRNYNVMYEVEIATAKVSVMYPPNRPNSTSPIAVAKEGNYLYVISSWSQGSVLYRKNLSDGSFTTLAKSTVAYITGLSVFGNSVYISGGASSPIIYALRMQ